MTESVYVLGDEDRRKFARLVAAAWEDGDLRAQYESEPRALLTQYGIAYPQGVPAPLLPPKPEGEFDITNLEYAAGGQGESSTVTSVSTVSTISSTASLYCGMTGCLEFSPDTA